MALNLPRLRTDRFYAIHPSTGRPVSLGSVMFFAPGTTEPKSVFTDRGGENLASNPVTLDPVGSCDVFLQGAYRIEVSDAQGRFLYSQDYINSAQVEEEAPASLAPPAALIRTENLTDLENFDVARAALGLTKQASTLDGTAGRVLLVGGLGYGGDAVAAGVNNMNNLIQPGIYAITSTGGIANIPSGADGGVVEVKRTSATRVVQVWEVAGAAGVAREFKRALTGAGWTPWAEVYNQRNVLGPVGSSGGVPTGALMQAGSVAGGRYRRAADGHQTVRLDDVDFTYHSPNQLRVIWAYQTPFVRAPIVSVMFPEAGANYVGHDVSHIGIVRMNATASSVTIYASRVLGAPVFDVGDKIVAARLFAEGELF